MRDIKFKGFYHFEANALYPEVNKWVYGSLIADDEGCWIKEGGHTYRVDPETVGQYIGEKDCKRTEEHPEGQEIFEGDDLRVRSQYDTYDPIDSFPNKVYFRSGAFRCGFHDMILTENVCSGVGNWNVEVEAPSTKPPNPPS